MRLPLITRRACATSGAALIVAIAGCVDAATAPHDAAPRPVRPVAAIAPGLTPAPVVYDQSLSGTGIMSVSSGGSVLVADDFIVPAGQTRTIAQVMVSGRLAASFGTLPLSIRENVNGAPGAAIANASATLAPSATGASPCCVAGPNPLTDYLFTLPQAITLGEGTYWLAAEVTTAGALRFEWHAVSPTQKYASPIGSLDGGATWTYAPFTSDLGFALFGPAPAQQSQAISFAPVTPNPAIVGATATLAATATSGLAVTFSAVASDGVCTVSGATVSFVGAGTCRVAADQAGDGAYLPASRVTQDVAVDFQFTGFRAPVDNDALNSAKAGQAIPLRWRLTDAAGAPVTTLAAATVTVVSLPCDLGSSIDQVEEYAAGGSGLQNLGDGYYQLNWKTPTSYARSCKTMRLDLGEGSGVRTARFQFTK